MRGWITIGVKFERSVVLGAANFRVLDSTIELIVNENTFVSNFNSFLAKPSCMSVHLSIRRALLAFLSSGVK